MSKIIELYPGREVPPNTHFVEKGRSDVEDARNGAIVELLDEVAYVNVHSPAELLESLPTPRPDPTGAMPGGVLAGYHRLRSVSREAAERYLSIYYDALAKLPRPRW